MSGILKMSEAASIAMHGMVYLAGHPEGPVSVADIAHQLKSSEHHLSKVFQRMTRAGLLKSRMGRRGGFVLAKATGSITLLEVYEAIEGPLRIDSCLLARRVCGGKKCILGDLLKEVGKKTKNHLSKTKLSQLTGICKSAKRAGGKK